MKVHASGSQAVATMANVPARPLGDIRCGRARDYVVRQALPQGTFVC